MDFSIFFFSADGSGSLPGKYRLLRESATFADTHGFTAIWTPERHFDAFGGLYPNPAVTSAALAMITQRIRLRAGSVVLPLQNPLRVAEEWSVVDNLSDGRVELSVASGWHANDFALWPDAYAERRSVMFERLQELQRLWSGLPVLRKNGEGKEIEVRIFPRPIQPSLPLWVTCQSDETFVSAGERGLHVLTNFTGKTLDDLAAKIRLYRSARLRNGHRVDTGKIALMTHTFVGNNREEVHTKVSEAYSRYLFTNLELQSKHFERSPTTTTERSQLVAYAVDRLFEISGLVGTPQRCVEIARRWRKLGVTELACLIDFGLDVDDVLESLPLLNLVREQSALL